VVNSLDNNQMLETSVMKLVDAELTTERYVSDTHFSKDATFFHSLRNSLSDETLVVTTQDFFIESLKPYLHELVVLKRSLDGGDASPVTRVPASEYKVGISYFRDKDGPKSGDNLVTISGLEVPPRSEFIITFGVSKSLLGFEAYPNDPSRGFNVPHMPVLYRRKTTQTSLKQTISTALMVQIPEPDFSMPFNVNSVANVVIGIFFVNMYNVLVKPKRFEN